MIWFTADTHFYHNNVIKYCNRPFDDVDQMNEVMINNWNSVVSHNDTVYHLGDVGLCKPNKLAQILKKLKGKKHLILGNHDKHSFKCAKFREQFETIHDGFWNVCLQSKGKTYKITLCHYAMRTWLKSCHGSWMLYGHSHGQLPDNPNLLSFDVGVDCHNFSPLSLDDVIKIMSKKLNSKTEDYIKKN